MDELIMLQSMNIQIKEEYDNIFNYFRFNEKLPLNVCNEKAAVAGQKKRDELLIYYYQKKLLEKLNLNL